MSSIAQQDQEIIVRGSEEHKEYLKYQHGAIKDKVNTLEAHLAVTGRIMLLVYIAYITVIATVSPALPANKPPLVAAILFTLDVIMSLLQVLGLEGSVPGLIHLADDLESKERHKEADKVRFAATTAQILVAATGINIVLQITHKFGAVDIGPYVPYYGSVLFVVRLIVIGMYLKEMARLEHKGPRIISPHEAAKIADEKEQKQIRIDNAAIMAVVTDEIKKWVASQPGLNTSVVEELSGKVERMETEMESKMESVLFPFLGKMESEMESVLAEMERGIEAKWKGEMESIRAFLESKMETRRITVQELPESPLPPVRKPLQLPTRQQPASQPIGDMGAFIHDCMRQGITTTSAIQSHAVKQGMKAPGTGTISRYRSTFQAGNMESKMERA